MTESLFLFGRRQIAAALTGVCGGLAGAVLGFTVTDWRWWIVVAVAVTAHAIGAVAE